VIVYQQVQCVSIAQLYVRVELFVVLLVALKKDGKDSTELEISCIRTVESIHSVAVEHLKLYQF